jgi:phosphoribosylformylglycinamidine cyclo-ligase
VKESYAKAGVDIDAKNVSNRLIGKLVSTTHRPEVLSDVGFFSGMFEFKGYEKPVLVSSTDSVGTKVKLAIALDSYDTIGIDIVNHCVNDIFTCGAKPIFFLDYIGIGKLIPDRVAAIVSGLAKACREVGCPLIGGETAEMPDIYTGDDFDLAGFVVGVVEKDKIIAGKSITAGDTIIGLPSNGLHTNGYTLARKVFGDNRQVLSKHYPELGRTIGEVLLAPHTCYYNQLKPLLPSVKGMAHITGGGLIDNVPRVLPQGLAAKFDSQSWSVPPIFNLIQKRGSVDREEMYHVFNMGIGMVVICSKGKVSRLTKALPNAMVIGEVIKQKGEVRVVIK